MIPKVYFSLIPLILSHGINQEIKKIIHKDSEALYSDSFLEQLKYFFESGIILDLNILCECSKISLEKELKRYE